LVGKSKVFVIGAGFTRAFLPKAPLLVDYYEIDELIERFKSFPEVTNILKSEREKYNDGRVNIENLFTRIQSAMPYDLEQNIFAVLLSNLQDMFLLKLKEAKKGEFHSSELAKFAQYCINNNIDCVTFNYDDILDEALWQVKRTTSIMTTTQYWHPDGGYGFFCRPSICCVTDTDIRMDVTAMRLLKLHGSVNWYARFGSAKPYTVDSIVHHEEWLSMREITTMLRITASEEEISEHLENDPFIVPPVLIKSAIMEQTVLKLIWRLAYKTLLNAEQVIFLGYSMPITDISAHFLFREALMKLSQSDIKVVNCCAKRKDRRLLKQAYNRVFLYLTDDQFDYRDVLEWVRELP